MMEKARKKLLIITTWSGFFATKLVGTAADNTRTTMDTSRLKELFEKEGFQVTVTDIARLDTGADYTGVLAVYCSSEDNGAFYRGYIGDALVALMERGAVLIPSYQWFRAHSNKVLQEMLRRSFKDERLRVPSSHWIGDLKELDSVLPGISYPAVVKLSGGSGSRGVAMAESEAELRKLAARMMDHHYRDCEDTLYLESGLMAKRILRRVTGRRVGEETILPHMETNKVVIQEFIPGLSGDYKVLYFLGRYYCLSRKNREDDFRASGSGRFSYPEDLDEITGVLDLAEAAAAEIGMPMMSLDIGKSPEGVFLIEFQCVFFGPYTLQFAPFYCSRKNGAWTKTEGTFDLEEEYVRAVSGYVESRQ